MEPSHTPSAPISVVRSVTVIFVKKVSAVCRVWMLFGADHSLDRSVAMVESVAKLGDAPVKVAWKTFAQLFTGVSPLATILTTPGTGGRAGIGSPRFATRTFVSVREQCPDVSDMGKVVEVATAHPLGPEGCDSEGSSTRKAIVHAFWIPHLSYWIAYPQGSAAPPGGRAFSPLGAFDVPPKGEA